MAELVAQAEALTTSPTGPLQISDVAHGGSDHFLSLVLPTYNEVKNIREIIAKLTALLEGALGGKYELIVVDDDSPDRTWEVAQGLAAAYPRLRVIRRVAERG